MSEINTESNANQNNSNSSQNPGDASSASSAEAKYTQDDFNKLAANKAKEVEKKIRAEYADKQVISKDDYQKALQDAIQKGEERAKMTADQKASAEFDDRQKSLAAERAEFQAEMDSFKADRALSSTKEALIDAGLSKDFAPFLTDGDADKRASNVANFSKSFKSAVDAAVEKQLAGKKTPENTSEQPVEATGLPKTKEEFFKLPMVKQNELFNDPQYGDYVRKNYYNL